MARRSMGTRGSSSSSSSRSSFSSGGSRSSFSSGSSRSHSSWGHSRGFRHHSSVHFHGSIPISSKAASIIAICVFLFIGAAFMIVGMSHFSRYNTLMNVKKSDYAYYQNMIENAENNSAYMTTGKVTYIEFDQEVSAYYFEYTVEGRTFSTFACYDDSSVPLLGGNISVALSCPVSEFDQYADSMPVSYKETSLEDDGEYRSLRGDRSVGIGFASFGAVFVVIGVVMIVKTIKSNKTEEVKEPSVNDTIPPVVEKTTKYCNYCGAENDKSRRKCHSCGARLS